MRTLYTQRAQVTDSDSKIYSNRGENAVSASRKVVCRYYNIGRCAKDNIYVSSGTTYRHICNHCFKVYKKAMDHPENKCSVKKNGKN